VGDCWAPPVRALGQVSWNIPRTRWAFYGYYIAHIGLLAFIS